MGIRVDPRTGMIQQGKPRPFKPPVSPHMVRLKKTDNMFPARNLPQGEVRAEKIIEISRELTPEQLLQLAAEISKAIAAQIQPVQVQANSAVQSQVDIDESIIDVGIGDQEPLEKGSGSVSIVNETIVEDSIADSKRALKALKKS